MTHILPYKDRIVEYRSVKTRILAYFMQSIYDQCFYFPQETADLVTFTEEILNGKLHLLCSESNDLQ